jgi:hypothetical protein
LTAERIQALRELLPEAFTEDKIDFEKETKKPTHLLSVSAHRPSSRRIYQTVKIAIARPNSTAWARLASEETAMAASSPSEYAFR